MNGSNSKITYHQQISYCGKQRCRRCREGIGHGPYWYAYQTIDGRTTRTYIGKHLSAEAQATMEGMLPMRELPVPASSEHEQLRIYTLGQFRLERRDGSEWQTVTDAGWQQQRVRALLSCLISNSSRRMGRELLLDTIWPDQESENASNRLDRAVHSLRQVFEPSRSKLATSPLLLIERELLVLADQQHIWIDADAFEHFLTKARESTDPTEKEQFLEEAVTLYSGEFLPEERSVEVTLMRRESLQRSLTGLLIELAELRIARDAVTDAIEPLNQLLSIDPANEAAVQLLMRVLAQLGRRGEAIRAYKRLATVLAQEYKIAPLPATRTIYEAVRATGNDATHKEVVPTMPAPQIGRTHQSPLVGRSQELKSLQTLLGTTEQAAKFKIPGQRKHASSLALDTQRMPQCMLLMGEVGIGKTRLAEEIGREARKRGWLVAWSRVYAQEGGIPYRLWIEVLRKAITNGMVQRQEISKRPLVYQPLNTLLPEMHSLLPQVEFPAQMPAEQEQLRLWEAARELLTNVAEGTPLLIVLDDLQWSDGSSCELLAYLARRIYGHPIIIIGTCRDKELPTNHALRPLLTDLKRERVVETVSLEPLSNEQIATLVTQIAQPTLSLPEPIVEVIQDRAAGNPFFAEELVRGVEIRSGTVPLPASISAAIDLRVSRLSKACHRLLSKAAVLGGSFEFPLIQAMESTGIQEADEDTILDLLEEGLKSGMLTEEGVGTRITYLFWHPLLVSHLYEGLSAARRANLHRRAADVLRQTYQYREEEGAAIITHHLVLGGGDPQHIIHYAELAGDHAYALSAYPEAEKHYRTAVEYLENIARKPIDAEEQLHIAYLLERLGECTFVQGKAEEARHFYERVLDIRSKQHLSVLSSDARQEAQIQALLWCEIGRTWYGVGNSVQTRQSCKNAEQILRDANIVDGAVWAKIRLQQSYVSWQEGKYDDASYTAQEALSLFQNIVLVKDNTIKDARFTHLMNTFAGDSVDVGRIHRLLAAITATTGHSIEALSHLNTALAIFEQYNRERDIAHVSCNLGDIYLKRSDHSLAQSTLRRSLGLAEKIGDVPLLCVVRGNLGVLGTRLGELAEAEDWFRKGIELAERINDPVYMSILHAYLSIVLQEQGKFIEARKSTYCSLQISRSMHIAPCIGLALVALGSIYTTQSIIVEDDKERIQLLRRAAIVLQRVLMLEEIEAETKTEGKLLLAQVALMLGELEVAQQQALQMLQEAKQYELTWLVARTQRVLGSIKAALQKQEQARQYFEQALRTFQKRGMYLEEARTLRERSAAMLQHEGVSADERRKALHDLHEAQRMFSERGAELDHQITERTLAVYEQHVGV